jgi:hypothetical protein
MIILGLYVTTVITSDINDLKLNKDALKHGDNVLEASFIVLSDARSDALLASRVGVVEILLDLRGVTVRGAVFVEKSPHGDF